jgi:hypothetical protein
LSRGDKSCAYLAQACCGATSFYPAYGRAKSSFGSFYGFAVKSCPSYKLVRAFFLRVIKINLKEKGIFRKDLRLGVFKIPIEGK